MENEISPLVKEQVLTLLGQTKKNIEEIEKLLRESKKGEESSFIKVLKEVVKKGGVVDKEVWKTIGNKQGYDSRGLGGFFKGDKPIMVSIAGDKRAITERGKRLLEQEDGEV